VQSDVIFVDIFVDIERGANKATFFLSFFIHQGIRPRRTILSHNGSKQRGNHSDTVIKAPH
jgi:hypothetical protein